MNAFPFLSWKELSRAEWLHTAAPKLLAVLSCEAVAHLRMYHEVWVFPPSLFHFSFSFTFVTQALHLALVRMCCFSLCPWLDWQCTCWLSRSDNLGEPSSLHLVNGYSNLSTFCMGTFQSSVTFIIYLLT